MRRPDREAVSKLPIGVIPVGSSNMFASTLHADGEADHSTEGEAGWAALTVALQETKKVDVLELTTHDGHTAYALSAVGWGAPGVMAEQSEKQAWLRSHRYWYGAAVGMLGENSETSASTRVRLAYPKGNPCRPPVLPDLRCAAGPHGCILWFQSIQDWARLRVDTLPHCMRVDSWSLT